MTRTSEAELLTQMDELERGHAHRERAYWWLELAIDGQLGFGL